MDIVTYSYQHSTIDFIARKQFSSNLGIFLSLDIIAVIDYGLKKLNIIDESGNIEEYNLFLKPEDITMKDLEDNLDYFKNYGILYDVFYYYEDEFIYKVRPDFMSYYEDYKNGKYDENTKIRDIMDKHYLIYTKKDNRFVDSSMLPTNDYTLRRIMGTNDEDVVFSKLKSYDRVVNTSYDKETLIQIIRQTTNDVSKKSAYDMIKLIKEKEYAQ